MVICKPPWQQHPLDKWQIAFMKHTDNKTKMNVIMLKDNKSINAQGPDNNKIWTDLYNQAMRFET